MRMVRLLVKNKGFGHTQVSMMMNDEDVERLHRLSDRLDESLSEVVGYALKLLEIRLDMYESCGIIVDDIKEE